MVDRIDLAEEPAFDLGGIQVRPAERTVIANGDRRELQPRVMQVLVALAKERPEVVSRDRLIELCWEGRVVGDDALNRCILALRHLVQDIAPAPFAIETVPKIGHRLIETPIEKGGGDSWKARAGRWPAGAVIALLLLAVIAGFFLWQEHRAAPEPASIAVLPFRNLSAGDPYFAEGVGEEILGQLSREPEFRVAGSSSSSQFGRNPDVRQVARRLNVDYVLEGSVRRQGNRVRVSANLMRATDGIRLWAESYDGTLDDIFAIQQRIGGAIAAALKRKLVRAPALSGPLVTKGEAYDLYLTARALIRTRNRRIGPTAADLLRDAIRIDPGYAPAWASLADATQLQGALKDHENYIAAIGRARVYASNAVRLAPDLSEAHRSLGATFGHGDPEGVAHFKRAAALDPGNAENLIELGGAFGALGEFENELAAYRRANAIDPLWYRSTGQTAIGMAKMGDRAKAEAFGREGLRDKDANLDILLGRIAWIFGDYSEAARRWDAVVRSQSPRWAPTALRTLRDAEFAAGIRTGPLTDVPQPIAGRNDWRTWLDEPPSPQLWLQRNRDAIAAEVYRKHNLLGAKLMLNASRSRELAATYDGPVGLFGLGPRKPVRFDQIHEVPVVALALRDARRSVEADRLLQAAEAEVRAAYRRGRVPLWFEADSASLLAVQGRKDEALATLERAFQRGWRLNGDADLSDINDEPAYRMLRGEPRFERLRARLADHYARERGEIARLALS